MPASHAASSNTPLTPEAMEAFWLPMTPNRAFKAKPRLFVAAEGMHYVEPDGRRILDGMAGLWCVDAGHGQKRIVRPRDGRSRPSRDARTGGQLLIRHPTISGAVHTSTSTLS